jgi:hypothetical protein
LIIAAFAQTQPQLPEIITQDGLPTASTRRVIELPNGSVLVATDGGIHFAPEQQPSLSRIKKTVGIVRGYLQSWFIPFRSSTGGCHSTLHPSQP